MSERPIKFRAWDTKAQKYLYPYPEAFWIIGETTVFDMLKQISIKDFNSILVEQFTGLTDRNGKEIYEGDIIIMNPMDDEGYGEVMWKSEFGRFEFRRYKHIDQTDACDISFICSITEFGKGENGSYVIGNIHENSDLIQLDSRD